MTIGQVENLPAWVFSVRLRKYPPALLICSDRWFMAASVIAACRSPITEETLDEAIASVIGVYATVGLHKHWGLGERASADVMKWDVHPASLMTEYHVRYGGYGGISNYPVSDAYIALFSRFIACDAYEGHSILDFVTENRSLIRPLASRDITGGEKIDCPARAAVLVCD